MLISEPPLQVLPTLAMAIGLNEAIFVQQLHYWVRMSQHFYEGRRWIYNSNEDWQSQFPFWSGRTLQRVIKRLQAPLAGTEAPLVLTTTRFNQSPMNQIKWYTIDYEQLDLIELQQAISPLPMATDGPSGQIGEMGVTDWRNGTGQSGEMGVTDWQNGTGQNGQLSLRQRLLETREGKTHTPCVREMQERESDRLSETPVTQSPSLALPVSEGMAGTESPPIDPDLASSAADLVQYFYRIFHHIETAVPTSKALGQAVSLLAQHGLDKARYLVDFSHKEAAKTNYNPQSFGGILHYQPLAFTAFGAEKTRHEAHQVKASAEQAEAREMELRRQYEQDCQPKLAAYQASLSPEILSGLKEEIRTEVIAREDIAPVALRLELRLELDQRLLILASLPSFEDWLSRQKET